MLGCFMTAMSFGQSIPAHVPAAATSAKQYASLTASLSSRLPASWQSKDSWGRIHRLRPLSRHSQPVRPKTGLSPTGESRWMEQDWRDGWQSRKLTDGRVVWRVAIQSPGAQGLRLHFQNLSLGEDTLWIYPDRENRVAPAVLGPFTEEGLDFWSGTVFGDTAILEVESTNQTEAPSLDLDRLLHLYDDPAGTEEAPLVSISPPAATVVPAATCEIDATCYPQYNNLASATLHFQFLSDDGFAYVCSGALINTRSSSLKPYVATANHCIGSDKEARSVEAYFNYASRTCNATPVFREDAFRVSGARYMAGGGWNEGDYSLLLLNSSPPAGTVFLGWSASEMPFNTNFVGLHYPRGSWRRIAIGTRRADESSRVEGEFAPAASYFQLA